MRKLILVLMLVIPLAPASAGARTVDPPQMGRVTMSALRHEIAEHRMVVGPNRYTGYGKLVITGLVSSRGRYRATYRLYDERRIVMSGQRALAGFCWPWTQLGPFGGHGCAGWNNPGSWNWGGLFDIVAKKFVALKPGPLQWAQQQKCNKGMIKAAGLSQVTRSGISLLMGSKDWFRVTAQGWLASVIGGCLISLWW